MMYLGSSRGRRAGRASASVLTAVTVLLSGCGKEKAADETQIAAKVNKDEISVHQVQYVLQHQPRIAAAQPQMVARRALDSLIEQELAAQAARSEGLDTDPSVVQAMEAAKRQVLARAFQDRVAAKAISASSDEIDRYYDSSPALFSERRLYTLQEFTVDTQDDDATRIQAALKDVKNAGAIGAALTKAGVRFRTRQFAQAAEELPMGVLESLAKLGVGEYVLTQQPGGSRLYVVLQVQTAPVNRSESKGAIQSYLLLERKRALVAQEMKTLHERAQIVYQGTFAQAGNPASAAASAAK